MISRTNQKSSYKSTTKKKKSPYTHLLSLETPIPVKQRVLQDDDRIKQEPETPLTCKYLLAKARCHHPRHHLKPKHMKRKKDMPRGRGRRLLTFPPSNSYFNTEF